MKDYVVANDGVVEIDADDVWHKVNSLFTSPLVGEVAAQRRVRGAFMGLNNILGISL